MKIKKLIPRSTKILAVSGAGILFAGLVMAQTSTSSEKIETNKIIIVPDAPGAGTDAFSPGDSVGAGSSGNAIRIESIEPSPAGDSPREVTWLGLSTEEAPDVLTAQLGLKPGQGLVVVFVAPDSPAAKAGLEKYDVIEELNDQVLVGAEQLRKLIQMQKEGDAIQLTFHRAGKKQTVSVTLAKRKEDFGMRSPGRLSAFIVRDNQSIKADVQRNVEEARRSIQDALRESEDARRAVRLMPPEPPAMPEIVDIGGASTVTMTKDGASVKTVVKSDDTGVIVIVANPKKHLTAHDANGKLLFDGDIETQEQQGKVPVDLWKKTEPLLEQAKPSEDEAPQPHVQLDRGSKF